MTSDGLAATSMPALQRVSSVEAVMQVLREQVFEGSLSAGTPLREGLLTDQLSVSRHTIRVALANLAHEGVVRLEANRGAFVRELTSADVEDCYRMRELLELTAVESVAGHSELLKGARAACAAMVRAGADDSWSASREADLEFHRQLVAALGSPRMLHAYESLLTDLRLCFLVEGFKDMDLVGNAEEHTGLLDIIEGGDVAAATQALRTHLRTSRAEALSALAGS